MELTINSPLLAQEGFKWHEYDFRSQLQPNYQEEVVRFAEANAAGRVLRPTSVTSREARRDLEIPVFTADGLQIRRALPWMFQLYHGPLRRLAQRYVGEMVLPARDWRRAITINMQKGTRLRYECHVDSNPLTCLLYMTDHRPGDGGELVVAKDPSASGVDQIRKSCTRIYPKAGHAVFFDARRWPHFVTPLSHENGLRVVAVMNYYTPSCPEDSRPDDLDEHLYGSKVDLP